MNVQFPRFLQPLLGKLTWHKSSSSKVIYITFDDGPVPEVTPQVIEILDKYGWKATFFCVGENVQKFPEVYADIVKKGHKVGNHTFNHRNGFVTSTSGYIENIQKAAKFIDSRLFRPPYGRITRNQINALKNDYEIIMWDFITHDYDTHLSPQKILSALKRNLRNGSIVVFHDSIKAKENVLEVLPKAIEFWEMNGYVGGVL